MAKIWGPLPIRGLRKSKMWLSITLLVRASAGNTAPPLHAAAPTESHSETLWKEKVTGKHTKAPASSNGKAGSCGNRRQLGITINFLKLRCKDQENFHTCQSLWPFPMAFPSGECSRPSLLGKPPRPQGEPWWQPREASPGH